MSRFKGATVSVVITCFNGERWIADAIDSALAQTYAPGEIIVIDDASGDGSREILRRYESYRDVKLLFHERNKGIPAAKNSGLAHCTGRYVAFLEQDDCWYDNKLARQVEAMEADVSLGMVFADAVVAGPRGREYLRRRQIEVPDSTEKLVTMFFLHNPVISLSSVMFRRAVFADLGPFDERYAGGDDYEFFLRLAGRYGIAFIDEPLLRYRWDEESFSWVQADRMLEDQLRTVEEAVRRYPYLDPLASTRRAQTWLAAGLRAHESGQTARGLGCALEALRADPWFAKSIPALTLMATGAPGRWLLRRRRWTIQFRQRAANRRGGGK